ncbi:pentapeptide repeat-containing protein, partial [Bacillus wiedmannii]
MSEFVNKEYIEIDFQDVLIKEEELKNCTFIKCSFRGGDATEVSTENCNFIE